MLKLTSPSNSNVQKFEAIPPGQTPITNNPKPIRESWIRSIATPNANCSQIKKKKNTLQLITYSFAYNKINLPMA